MYAVLYNIFCCWMITIIGGTTYRHIILYRDRFMVDRSFAFFWLFSACLWFCSGFRQAFYYFGFLNMDRYLFYVVQVFVLIHMIPGISHTVLKITRNGKVTKYVLLILSPLFAAFLFFIFYDGVELVLASPWSTEYSISPRTFAMFLPGFLLAFLGNVYDFIARLVGLARGKGLHIESFCSSLAMILYCGAGVVDVKGVISDWRFLVIRAMLVLAALISYTGYYWESDSSYLQTTVQRSDL